MKPHLKLIVDVDHSIDRRIHSIHINLTTTVAVCVVPMKSLANDVLSHSLIFTKMCAQVGQEGFVVLDFPLVFKLMAGLRELSN